MKIALGSNRAAKIEAVRAAVARIAIIDAAWGNVEMIARSVETNAPAMPLTRSELLYGARERALAVRDLLSAENSQANLYIGLEGGFDTIEILEEPHTFLCGWAYVTDGIRYAYGSAPSIFVPTEIVNRVTENNMELAQVIDEVAGEKDVRSRQGAWGVLSRDLFKRAESFEIALLAALAPFYNSMMY